MPLAGVMGAGMPEPTVEVPMLLEPMGAGGGKTTVSSIFLLQAPNASKVASATEVAARVLIF